MTKVVLNNDITKKELSMCTKLHYLENKYGKIAVYMYHAVIDRFIRVYNPYSFCGSEISDVVVYHDNTPDVIDMRYVYDHKALYDSSVLTLDKLRYDDAIDCVWPQKMKISILLFQYEDNWVLYGIGGVNAPRIPFFTQRIQTSFINRIKTFCSFIFQKL